MSPCARTGRSLPAGGAHVWRLSQYPPKLVQPWESEGGSPPPPGTTGLYHVAILYPTRADLADALKRLVAHGVQLDGAADHGVSEALYLHDPDMNGIELYWDKPQAQWPRNADGTLAMVTERLDLNDLINTHH